MRRLGRVDPEGLPVGAPLVQATTGDGAICVDTSTYHYRSRTGDQAAVERRIKEIAATRVRYGYRRRSCASETGGLGDRHEQNPSDLQRVGLAAQEQAPQTPGEG